MKYDHFVTLLVAGFFSVSGSFALAQTAEEFENLKNRLHEAKAQSRTEDLKQITAELRQKITPSLFEPGERTFLTLRAAKYAVSELLASPHLKSEKARTSQDEAIVLFEDFLMRTLKQIDPKWVWKPGSANILPPEGVSSAQANMGPESIPDLKLRKQYLDLLENAQKIQLINRQQHELREVRNELMFALYSCVNRTPGSGWTADDIRARFGKDKACLEQLDYWLNR